MLALTGKSASMTPNPPVILLKNAQIFGIQIFFASRSRSRSMYKVTLIPLPILLTITFLVINNANGNNKVHELIT